LGSVLVDIVLQLGRGVVLEILQIGLIVVDVFFGGIRKSLSDI